MAARNGARSSAASAVASRTAKRTLMQAGWGVGDQALSSVTNFMLAIVVAHSVDTEAFGAFAIAFTTYVLAIGACRAATSEPLTVRYSAVGRPQWDRGVSAAVGAAAIIGAAIGAVSLAASLLAAGSLRAALLALAVAMPGLLVQDTWRFAFFARGAGKHAFFNDLVWAVTLVPAVALMLSTGRDDIGLLVLAWGSAGTVAAAAGVVQARVVPNLARILEWWREQGDLAPRFVGQFAAITGAASVAMYGVGLIAGLNAAGVLRAGDILFAPFRITLTAVGLFAIPAAVRVARTSHRQLLRSSQLLAIGLALAALAWGAVIFALPGSIGTIVLGPLWRDAHAIVLPLAAGLAGLGVVMGALVALRALAAARRSLRARLAAAPLIVCCPLIGAAAGGAAGSAAGFAVAFLGAAVVSWWQLRHAFRDQGTSSASSFAAPVVEPR